MNIAHVLYSHNGLFNQYCSFQHLAGIAGHYKDHEINAVNNVIHWKIQDPQDYQVNTYSIDNKLNNFLSAELLDLIDYDLPNVSFHSNDYFLKDRLNSNIIQSQLSYLNAQPENDMYEDYFSGGRTKINLYKNKQNIFTMTLSWYSKSFMNRTKDIDYAISTVKFKEPYINLASKIAKSIGPFNGAHVRVMEDHFQYYTFNNNKINIGLNFIDNSLPIFISVDDFNNPILKEINKEYFFIHEVILNDFYEDFKNLPYSNRVVLGLISSLVMSMANDFVGTPLSTYTAFIHQERHRHGLPSFKFFPGKFDNINNTDAIFSWNKYSASHFSWEREWEECYIDPAILDYK
jgi:hypothetical protein